MSVYRESGQVAPVRQVPDVIALIREAWVVLRERRDAHVGPEPSRWRIFAHSDWEDRKREWEFATPTVSDLIDARDRIGAGYSVFFEALNAHRDAHMRRS